MWKSTVTQHNISLLFSRFYNLDNITRDLQTERENVDGERRSMIEEKGKMENMQHTIKMKVSNISAYSREYIYFC